MENVSLGLVVAVMLAVAALLLGFSSTGEPVKKQLAMGFSVNGETVTSQQIDKVYSQQPDKTKTKEQVADELVSQRVLVQKATEKGIMTSDAEIEQAMMQMRTAYMRVNLSLETALAQQGITLEEYKKQASELLAVTKFLNEELHLKEMTVSEQEIDDYIEKNSVGYDEIKSDQEFAASYRNRVKQELLFKKQQGAVLAYTDQLKSGADIKPVVG